MSLCEQPAPEALASAHVVYPHGGAKRVDGFWSRQPCLLLFLRHFACPGCWSQIDQLLARLPELKRAGLRVVLVALADPARLLPFRERVRLEDADVELVTDPSLACHRSAGMVRGAWSTYGPVAVATGLRLYLSGYFVRHEDGDGDLQQQGGALVVDRAGCVRFHHAGAHLGDFVDFDDVLVAAGRCA